MGSAIIGKLIEVLAPIVLRMVGEYLATHLEMKTEDGWIWLGIKLDGVGELIEQIVKEAKAKKEKLDGVQA